MKKYNSIQGLRALGALTIVLVHVLKNLYPAPYTGVYYILSHGEVAVLMFLAISAFGMCCGYYDKIKNNTISINDFYSRRYKKILPFWIIMLILGFLSKPSTNYAAQFILEAPLTFNINPYPNLTLLSVGWTLGLIFSFYLLFPFFVFLLWSKRRSWIVLFLSILLSNVSSNYYFQFDNITDMNFHVKSLAIRFPYFVLGGIIYLYKDNIANFFINLSVQFMLLIRLLMILCVPLIFGHSLFSIGLLPIFVLGYAVCFPKYPLLESKVLCYIGDISMEIYLCHMFIYRLLEKFDCLYLFENYHLNFGVMSCIVFGGACLFAFVNKRFIIPFILRFC